MMPTPQRAPSVVVTVGEFAARLREVFRRVRAFEYLGVTGEISQWNPRANGVYFTIKDANAVLECFAYSNRAARFPKVALGTAVVALGAVRVVERRSRYELLVDQLQLTGVGELYQEYEALKERFRAEGLFDPKRKRQIPRFPRRVALVSASDGKGAEDFLKIMRESVPHVAIEFFETRVQGFNAETEVADALDRASRAVPDLIVLARGGGSYEDLFTFNREAVVRAILRAKVPVITGIGHTGDHHLADDVADLAVETPSNVAHYLANLWQSGNEQLARLSVQLDREMRDVLARALQRGDSVHDALERGWERAAQRRRDRLSALERQLTAQSPLQRLARRRDRLTNLQARIDGFPQRTMTRLATLAEHAAGRIGPAWEQYQRGRAHRLEVTEMRLNALDPAAPLRRGFALLMREGSVIHTAAEVGTGDRLTAQLGRGSLGLRVEDVRDE